MGHVVHVVSQKTLLKYQCTLPSVDALHAALHDALASATGIERHSFSLRNSRVYDPSEKHDTFQHYLSSASINQKKVTLVSVFLLVTFTQ